jgi:hypothetical protein
MSRLLALTSDTLRITTFDDLDQDDHRAKILVCKTLGRDLINGDKWDSLSPVERVPYIEETCAVISAAREQERPVVTAEEEGLGAAPDTKAATVMPAAAREKKPESPPAKLPEPEYAIHDKKTCGAVNTVADLLRERLPALPKPTAELPTVWYHGGRSYSVDGRNPHLVPPEQHNALHAFLDCDKALSTEVLMDAGVSNVSDVMKTLFRKYGEAVRLPAKKGPGYFIRVRTRKSDETTTS